MRKPLHHHDVDAMEMIIYSNGVSPLHCSDIRVGSSNPSCTQNCRFSSPPGQYSSSIDAGMFYWQSQVLLSCLRPPALSFSVFGPVFGRFILPLLGLWA